MIKIYGFIIWLGVAFLSPSMGWTSRLSVKEALPLIDEKKAIVLDVREESEVRETGLADVAILMPFSLISKQSEKWKSFLAQTPKDQVILLYCLSGGRSGKVMRMLKEKGYRQVYNMGGFADWKSGAGLGRTRNIH